MTRLEHRLIPTMTLGVVYLVSRFVLIAAFCLLCAGLFIGCTSYSDSVVAPHKIARTTSGLVCTDPQWDLGEVLVKGKSVTFEHSFHLENDSKETIRLLEPQADCGCLVTDGYSATIEPGGKTEINVTFSVAGPPGEFRRTILVKEESTPNEAIPISIHGRRAVSDLLYCSPETISFGTMTPNESRIKKLVLARYDGSPPRFRCLVSSDDRLSLVGEPVDFSVQRSESGGSMDCVEVPVKLELKGAAVGSFRSQLIVETDSADPTMAKLSVAVEATVVEDQTDWVKSIFIKRLEPGASVERPMLRLGADSKNHEDVSILYEGDESLLVDFTSGNGVKEAPKVKISRRADSTVAGLVRGTLRVRSGTEPESRIEIAAFLP